MKSLTQVIENMCKQDSSHLRKKPGQLNLLQRNLQHIQCFFPCYHMQPWLSQSKHIWPNAPKKDASGSWMISLKTRRKCHPLHLVLWDLVSIVLKNQIGVHSQCYQYFYSIKITMLIYIHRQNLFHIEI